ncbi:site-specific integrase [Siccirubricoccus sp. G192]|uniref:site-specific integrase n=1 Tax=Siccirubricoccus sp. G192 TaxID=2849651 RepID=UPI001C2BD67C|nr:site-specific integrase [Siccirubricoccus sp. G192]MBV1800593.1 site-specific integrase [Siccirubricoccus sp. G192]
MSPAPLAAWPGADRRLWLAALEPGDWLEPGGARAHCRPISNTKFAFGYGCWLEWLDAAGALDPAVPPGDRITPERVKAYLGDVAATRSTSTQQSRLVELYSVARVMDPGRDWGWIRHAAARVRARHRPVRDKCARTVGSRELYEFGLRLMDSAAVRATLRQRAFQFRDGLIIAFLAARPLRRRNLTGLRLGRHVACRDSIWWLWVPAHETKTETEIDMPWPEALVPRLEMYLAEHRPFLCRQRGRWSRPANAALWVSGDGSAMVGDAVYDRIILRTRREFGRGVNPHLFRDSAVTSLATEDPGHIGIAAPLLGHRDDEIATRHYNQASGIEATRSLQSVLSDLRDGKLSPPAAGC